MYLTDNFLHKKFFSGCNNSSSGIYSISVYTNFLKLILVFKE